MDPFSEQLHRAQYQYDMQDDTDDDADTEDDLSCLDSIKEEEEEDERFWRKHG